MIPRNFVPLDMKFSSVLPYCMQQFNPYFPFINYNIAGPGQTFISPYLNPDTNNLMDSIPSQNQVQFLPPSDRLPVQEGDITLQSG